MALDTQERKKEIAKLENNKRSNAQISSDFKTNPKTFTEIGHALDINLDTVFSMQSTDKVPALAYVLEDLDIDMVDKPYSPSTKLSKCKSVGTPEDIAVAAYLQRVFSVGNRFPDHPICKAFSFHQTKPTEKEIAVFTVSDIDASSQFNPYADLPVREEEKIEPELHYTRLLAESWSTLEDTERLPLYKDKKRQRESVRLTELAQIPVEGFSFTEDAKAIFKYGIGIQWSYESALKDVRMQLLGFWIMRRAIEQRTLYLMDAASTAIDFALENKRTYDIPQIETADAGDWTIQKLEDYNEKWRPPYMWNFMICNPKAKRKFKMMNYGSDNWTLGHFNMANRGQSEYVDERSQMRKGYISLEGLESIDQQPGGNVLKFGENDYLFLDTMNALGQVYNTGMAKDETEMRPGNQSYVRYFTFGNRFYGIIPSAVEYGKLL